MNRGSLLWWVIPEVLAGMPMPYIQRERRMNRGGPLNAYPDALPNLYAAGIRAVVSLLNIPSDAAVYESAGFSFLCLPIPDGHPPTVDQATKFVQFMTAQRSVHQPVAVHCEAGIGRTGTMIASYLISQGDDVKTAINKVRAVEPRAIETPRQIEFLESFAHGLKIIRFEGELLPKWAQLLDVAAIICSAPEDTRHWFSRFTHSPGVDDSQTIILQCESLLTAIHQRKEWLALQFNQSQDPQRVSQIIAALEYSLETMIQQARLKKTCSWTLDGFQKSDPRGDFGDGDITLRQA